MKAGFAALVGQPNSGKSTLFNWMMGQKISAVSAKPQTTRQRILGILPAGENQIVLVDPPGVIQEQKGLNAFLSAEVLKVLDEVDVVIAVLSLDEEKSEGIAEILSLVEKSAKPFCAVITKSDLVQFAGRKEKIRQMIQAKNPNAKIFELAKTWGSDIQNIIDEMKRAVCEHLPESPAPLYEKDLLTPHSFKDLCSEIIREKTFEYLHQEIPYSIAVRIRQFDETNPKLVKIFADIWVSKEGHKPMVIGKGGEVIKKIGTDARLDMEPLLEKKVFLDLQVTVKENWTLNPKMMKELGYHHANE